jgi:hypothetical protein
MNKYPKVNSVVQKVYKICSDIKNLAKFTPDKVRESSDWTSIVNNAENNRLNLIKAQMGSRVLAFLWHVRMY